MSGIDRANVNAWQAWLAIEHEAVWLYGVIGGRVNDVLAEARLSWNRHRDTRDRLSDLIRAAGVEPAGPQLGYADGPIDTEDAARTAAQRLEGKVTTASLACMTDEPLRSEVVTALRAAAQSAAEWGARPAAFPGLPLSQQ